MTLRHDQYDYGKNRPDRDPRRLFPDEEEMEQMDAELSAIMLVFVSLALGLGIPLGLLVSWLSR
jgi:hypothetical protein